MLQVCEDKGGSRALAGADGNMLESAPPLDE